MSRKRVALAFSILTFIALFSGCAQTPTSSEGTQTTDSYTSQRLAIYETLVFTGLKDSTVDVTSERVLVTYHQPPVKSELDSLTAWMYIMGASATIAPETKSIVIIMQSDDEPLYEVSAPTETVTAILNEQITMEEFRSKIKVRALIEPLETLPPETTLPPTTQPPTTQPPETTLPPTTQPPTTQPPTTTPPPKTQPPTTIPPTTQPPTTTPPPTTSPPTTTPPPTTIPPTTTPPPTTQPPTDEWTIGTMSMMSIVEGPDGDHNFFDFSDGKTTTSFDDGDIFFNHFGDIMGECSNTWNTCAEIKEETALSFNSMTKTPTSGYEGGIIEGAETGKRYWIKTLEGNYAKIELTYVSEDKSIVSFKWGYLEG